MNIQTHAQQREENNNKRKGVMTSQKKVKLGIKKEILEELADAYQYTKYGLESFGDDGRSDIMYFLSVIYNEVNKLKV